MTMGTASTMTAIAEALGLTLPGASSIPAADANHIRMAAECGRRIVEMVWEDLTPTRILTRAVVRERHRGRDGDGLLDQRDHPPDRHGAPRRRPASTLDDFDALSRDGAGASPTSGRRGDSYLMEDFFYAGGLPRADEQHRASSSTSTALTVTGKTLGENIEGAEVYNDDVIRPLDEPGLRTRARWRCCKGNLAPDGASSSRRPATRSS